MAKKISKKKKIAFSLFTLCLLTIIADIAIFYYVSLSGRQNRILEYIAFREGARTGLYQPNANTLYRLSPGKHMEGKFTVNDDGFRHHEIKNYKQIPSNSTVILLIGGSTTFCTELSDKQTWGYLLEDRLRKQYNNENIYVINAGVGGYTTRESLLALKHYGIQYKPDYILVHHAYNDVTARTMHDEFEDDYSHFRLDKWKEDDRIPFLKNSYFYNYFHINFTNNRHYKSIHYSTMKNYNGDRLGNRTDLLERLIRLRKSKSNSFKNNLTLIAEFAKNNGAVPIFITASVSQHAWQAMREGVAEHNQVMLSLPYQCIDLAKTFPSQDDTQFVSTYDVMHMSPTGALTKANIIYKNLKSIIDQEGKLKHTDK